MFLRFSDSNSNYSDSLVFLVYYSISSVYTNIVSFLFNHYKYCTERDIFFSRKSEWEQIYKF
jgi:hypothetical protein